MKPSQLRECARLPEGVEADLTKLAALADAHAFEVWGEDIARGESFPVADAAGDVRAFVFPYALGTRTFPADVAAVGRGSDPIPRFGAIYVAARPTVHPVLRVVHALHPLFVRGEQAEMIGRSILGDEACLNRIYWLGLHQEYFEVGDTARRVLLDVGTLKQLEPEAALAPLGGGGICARAAAPPTTASGDNRLDFALRKGSAASEAPTSPAPAAPSKESELEADAPDLIAPKLGAIEPGGRALEPVLKLVPLADCVPAVNWTWWCVPTAGTMATCYYDHYVKGVGGITGYGRLVGYWFDHPQSGHNVPDFIDQLIDPQTGTWRVGFTSFPDFIQKTYGYTFTEREVAASVANDWAWADMTAEIDAGRPFIWGVPNHATCAFGYRVAADGSRRIVLYTTWGDTPQEQREEWLHTEGVGMKFITPGGGTSGHNLVLWEPDVGAVLASNVATTIRWHVWGNQIKAAEISASADGGNTWAIVAHVAPCNPGWNFYEWTPPLPTDRARVRIRGLDAGGAYVAGDGSRENVSVLPGPRPVKLDTFLVRTTTNSAGFFSAPHGLERFRPDGYAIRALSVAVQHKNGAWHTLEFSHNVDNRFWWTKDAVGGVIASPNFFNQPVQVVISAEWVVG